MDLLICRACHLTGAMQPCEVQVKSVTELFLAKLWKKNLQICEKKLANLREKNSQFYEKKTHNLRNLKSEFYPRPQNFFFFNVYGPNMLL